MRQNKRLAYIQNSASGISRIGEFLGIDDSETKSFSDYKSGVRANLEYYTNRNQMQPTQSTESQKDLGDTKYYCIGYDVHLQEYLTKKGVVYTKQEVGTIKNYKEVFRKSNLIMIERPVEIVDPYGNVWRREDKLQGDGK